MLSRLLGRALRLSPKNTTSLLSISSRVPLCGSHHQLLRLKHAAPVCTTNLPSSYFSRSFPSGRIIQPTGICKPVLKQQHQPRFFSSNGGAHGQHPDAQPLPVLSPPAVGNWLLLSSTLVIAVIVVGGVTRLTESGLSITEWRPITGVLPPLSLTEWQDEFEKYRATPEFRLCVLRSPRGFPSFSNLHFLRVFSSPGLARRRSLAPGSTRACRSTTSSRSTTWNGPTASSAAPSASPSSSP